MQMVRWIGEMDWSAVGEGGLFGGKKKGAKGLVVKIKTE